MLISEDKGEGWQIWQYSWARLWSSTLSVISSWCKGQHEGQLPWPLWDSVAVAGADVSPVGTGNTVDIQGRATAEILSEQKKKEKSAKMYAVAMETTHFLEQWV